MELAPTNENSAYVKKLEDKLREYAKRLRELEDYKLKIEKQRILEVVPENIPYQQRIDKLKAENDLLKRQISSKVAFEDSYSLKGKVTQLEKEKLALEESLRGEMLMNEEQRSYIEMLKEALEAKVNDLGIRELIGKCKLKKSCDIITEIYTIKKEVDAKRKQIAEKESKIASAESVINTLTIRFEELKREHEKVAIEGKELIKREVNAKNEANRLNDQIRIAKSEVEATKSRLVMVESKLQSTLKGEAALKEKVGILESKIKEITRELESKDAVLISINKENDNNIKFRDDKIEELESKIATRETSIKELEQKNKKAQKDYDLKIEEYEKMKENLTETVASLTEKLETAKNELKEAADVVVQSRTAHEKEMAEMSKKLEQCMGWEERYEDLDAEHKRIRIEKEEACKKLDEATEELKYKDQKLLDSHSELEKVLDSFAELDEKYKRLVLDYDTTVKRCELDVMTARKREEEYRFQIERLRLQFENAKMEYDAKIADKSEEIIALKQNIEETELSYQKDLENKNRDIKEAREEAKKIRSELKAVKSNLTAAKEEQNKQENEYEYLKNEYEEKVQELTEHKAKIGTLSAQLLKQDNSLKEQHEKTNSIKVDLSKKQEEFERLTHTLNEHATKVQELTLALRKAENKKCEIEAAHTLLKAKLSKLESENKRLQDENVTLSTLLKEQAIRIESLVSDKLATANEINCTKDKLAAQRAENSKLITTLEEKTEQLSELSAIVNRIKEEQEEISKFFKTLILSNEVSLTRKDDSIFSWYGQVKDWFKWVEKELDTLYKEKNKDNEDIRGLKGYVNELEEKVKTKNEREAYLVETEATLRMELDREKSKTTHTKGELDTLQYELKQKGMEGRMREQSLEIAREEKKVLQSKIDTIMQENAILEKNLKEALDKSQSNAAWATSLEQKLKLVLAEKQDYEVLLMKLHSNASCSGSQKIIRDIITSQKDLHLLQRGYSSPERYEKRHDQMVKEMDRLRSHINSQVCALKEDTANDKAETLNNSKIKLIPTPTKHGKSFLSPYEIQY